MLKDYKREQADLDAVFSDPTIFINVDSRCR